MIQALVAQGHAHMDEHHQDDGDATQTVERQDPTTTLHRGLALLIAGMRARRNSAGFILAVIERTRENERAAYGTKRSALATIHSHSG